MTSGAKTICPDGLQVPLTNALAANFGSIVSERPNRQGELAVN